MLPQMFPITLKPGEICHFTQGFKGTFHLVACCYDFMGKDRMINQIVKMESPLRD